MDQCAHISGVDPDKYELAVKLSLAIATKNTSFKPECSACGALEALCCLECSHLGCLEHSAHAQHALAVFLYSNSQGYLWCNECNLLVVDPKLEQRRIEVLASALGTQPQPRPVEKPKRPPFHSKLGLRGFYNMGATCYMAVALQTLLHNPFVSQFFLSGGHDRFKCPTNQCIQCCVDEIFCEFFSATGSEACGIPDLLSAVVKGSSAMFSGASEQDAHEFLQFLLDQFHMAHKPMLKHEEQECSCITHRTFSGTLQSRLTCGACQYSKALEDALVDVSLEISGDTLAACLAKFTSPEKISNYACDQCGQKDQVTKQSFIARMPPVLQIQLKRFRHDGVSSKVERHVDFPLELDFSEYTSTPPSRPLTYELFGVLCHFGTMDTGHYTCMMKHNSGIWYQFDDTMVYPVPIKSVLKASAYLLFYCIKSL